MSRQILILCHNRVKPHICKIADVLHRLKIPYEICHTSHGQRLPKDTENYRGVIIMGGPMGVYDHVNLEWLAREIAWLDEFVKSGKPVFGICLGCQMLAHIYGGTVYLGEKGLNIGFREIHLTGEDRVFGDELEGSKVMNWQGDTYTIADHCEQLASGEVYHQQAVKFADKVYGVQFHPETLESTIERWYENPKKQDERFCDKACPPKEDVLSEAHKHLPQVHDWLEKFIERLFLRA